MSAADLGTPDELWALADRGLAPAVRPRVNSHIHLPPNFSAFETTSRAVELAAQQDVRVLGVSNYYDYAVYRDFTARARTQGIFPLYGLEIIALIDDLVRDSVRINDPGNPGKMYICGKGITRFDPLSPDAAQLLQVIRDNDSARMDAMTGRLAAIFREAGLETGLTADVIKDRVVTRHGCSRDTVYLQERHLAQAFQEVLFEKLRERDRHAFLERLFAAGSWSRPADAVHIQNEIRSHLMKAGKPAFIEDTFVNFDHAYRLILELGGIPCYPTLADGVVPLCPYEESVGRLIVDLQVRHIPAAEFIPVRNSPEVLSRYVRELRDTGLVITAGTEHNTLDLLPMEPTCANGVPIPDDIAAIFWEGACVVAAHQYLTLNEMPGFVDRKGTPCPGYSSPDQRVKAFARMGAAVIAKFQGRVLTASESDGSMA